MLIAAMEDSEPNCRASFTDRPGEGLPLLRPLFVERCESADLMLRNRLSGDHPRKRGRSVGRQMAIMPTPSSIMPQKSRSETTPMSSVASRPATLASARTDKVSCQGHGDESATTIHTWGNQDFDEDDHSCDPAGDCSVKLVSKIYASQRHSSVETLQRSNKDDAANGKFAFHRHLQTKDLHVLVVTIFNVWYVHIPEVSV